MFLIDIIIIFNSGVYDDDGIIMKHRPTIVMDYLKGWFLIDLVAIIPFEALFSKGESANLIRYTRIGRLNKMLKLMKLLRLTKLHKSGTIGMITWLQEKLQVSQQFRWHFSFFAFFALVAHVIACIWIIGARMGSEDESWIVQHYD